MNPVDFGLSVLASWLANHFDKNKNAELNQTPPPNSPSDPHSKSPEIKALRLFNTFDVYTESEDYLNQMHEPVAHFVVENSPTTFYNLASLILESKTTGEWYVFRRGRLAFQGNGGGYKQSKRIINILKDKEIPIATWAGNHDMLNNFESGTLLWPEIKVSLIPLAASVINDEDWEKIKRNAKTMLDDSEND